MVGVRRFATVPTELRSPARAWAGVLASALLCAGCLDGAVPSAPAGLVASPGNGSVQLTWLPNADIELKAYNVYWGTSANGLSQNTVVSQPLTSITLNSLINGQPYYFALD